MPSNVWKGNLTFGLVSVPVRLLRAARRERVRLHYVHRPGPAAEPAGAPIQAPETESHMPEAPPLPWERPASEAPTEVPTRPSPVTRVHQSLVASGNEQPVSRADILRGYEVEPDQYVVFDRDELKKLQRRTSASMDIIRSVHLSDIDPVFLETSYYVVPDRGGEKAYAILFAALRQTQHVALARVGMYGREHVVVLRPGQHGILAHTMFYVDEIRFENEFQTDTTAVTAKELELAKLFLNAIEAPFAPEEFKDVYREELQEMIQKKASAAGAAPAVEERAQAGRVVDILDALKKSIAMARNSRSQENPPSRKMPGRVTEIRNKRRSPKAR